ncbi:hypothetical protein VTL71DRAFT_12523 [Oculimacula yallundae]|uniref:Uncharacterized protein n=1 Tax=Oculimacula yallundae TaxID=86028 RepID=A0ABR4CPL5_9HELO
MAEASAVLGIVASMIAICSCATAISQYAISESAINGSAHSDLSSELKSLQASLSSLRHLTEKNAESLKAGAIPLFSTLSSQSENARSKCGCDNLRGYVPTLQHLLEDPPPTIFILACIIYTFLYMRLREKRRNDQYQDKFIISSMGLGIAAAAYTREWENLKGYVAWCAVAGLMLSATLHWVLRLGSDRGDIPNPRPTEALEPDLKFGEKGDWKEVA